MLDRRIRALRTGSPAQAQAGAALAVSHAPIRPLLFIARQSPLKPVPKCRNSNPRRARGSSRAPGPDDRLRVALDHGQVGADGDLRASPSVLPVPNRRHAKTEQRSEVRLGQAERLAHGSHVGFGRDVVDRLTQWNLAPQMRPEFLHRVEQALPERRFGPTPGLSRRTPARFPR